MNLDSQWTNRICDDASPSLALDTLRVKTIQILDARKTIITGSASRSLLQHHIQVHHVGFTVFVASIPLVAYPCSLWNRRDFDDMKISTILGIHHQLHAATWERFMEIRSMALFF